MNTLKKISRYIDRHLDEINTLVLMYVLLIMVVGLILVGFGTYSLLTKPLVNQ